MSAPESATLCALRSISRPITDEDGTALLRAKQAFYDRQSTPAPFAKYLEKINEPEPLSRFEKAAFAVLALCVVLAVSVTIAGVGHEIPSPFK